MRGEESVQYGCGWFAPREWRNFDISPTLRFERLPLIGHLYTKNEARFPSNVEYGDIVNGLPVDASSCARVYCSHVLEHLSLSDFRTALKNTVKIMRPGAIFRFVLPDLEFLIKQYVANISNDASLEFMKQSGLGYETRARGFWGIIRTWLGNSNHLWMWDYKSIKPECERVGLGKVRRASFGDSPDPIFKSVEDRERWFNCLGVECIKTG